MHYVHGNGSDEMLSQETALGEVNIGYKVCDEASYTSGSVCLPKFNVCVKKIYLDKGSAMSNHCNKKIISMVLVVFSFLFSEKYLHLCTLSHWLFCSYFALLRR